MSCFIVFVEGSDSDDEDDQQRKKLRSRTAKKTEPTTSKHQSQSARKSSSDSDSGMKKKPKSSDKDKESSSISSTSDDDNTENFEYVYRLLRPGEQFSDGIYPKDISSEKSILEHVLHGSHYNHKTKFISCCKSMVGIEAIAKRHRIDGSNRNVVKINVQKLNREEVSVIDLTTDTAGSQHLEGVFRAQDFSRMYEEIILEPKNCIPGDCIEKVATVRNRELFYETQ